MKTKVSGEIKMKVYTVLERAVEEGIARGYNRAYKHTDDPSEENIRNQIFNGVMMSISDIFDFGDEE